MGREHLSESNRPGSTRPDASRAGTGRRQSRDTLRLRALEVGQSVLAEEGARALTIRRIAQEIGCAVGTIYNLFDDLDHLLTQLNIATLRDLDQLLRDELSDHDGDDPEARLLLLARTYVGFTERNRNRWSAVLEAGVATPETDRVTIGGIVTGMVALVDLQVAALVPDDVEAQDRWRATVAMWSGIEGIGRLTSTGNLALIAAEMTAEQLIETQIRTFVRGLRQR